ncbi:MAG: 50S ribosomal protein L29 [Candidatus Omnitrophica bacterium]|nr:50S ribosomal protein L29 [Candidatus Omnitrophota bacterium]MCM8810658.1 50S ribosomal protein L29 [Candidatus Omnitrophota bacterium]
MKKEEFLKWKEATKQEIENKIIELKKRLYELRNQLILGQLKNYSQIKEIKRDIARLKTILREKEIGVKNDKKTG